MALTITFTDDNAVEGDRRVRRGTFTFDSSYPTGGELVTPAELRLNVVETLRVHAFSDQGNRLVKTFTSLGFWFVQLYTAISTEAANGSDQATISVPFEAIGY
jgi:hypothetical protein